MADPISALLAALPGLAKAGADIASASDQAKRNAQLIEFQQAVIGLQSNLASIQAENASLANRNRELEVELARLGDWENDKQRYSLVNPWEGAAVYALKQSHSNSEAPHWLCANCYQARKKTFLNQIADKNGWTSIACPNCRSQFQSPWRGQIPAKFAEDYAKDK